MAASSKISFTVFLLTLLSTQKIHARESQFFNKIPSNNNNNNNLANENTPKEEDPLDKLEQEPNFIPENQNGGYGLYGHESGQLPPSTTTPTIANTNLPFKNEPNYESVPKYLPKNYNTEAYVTEAEGYHPAQETNTNNYYNSGKENYQNPKQSYPASTTGANGEQYYQNPKQGNPAATTPANGDQYYQNYGGNSYNGQQQGLNEYNLGQKGYTTTIGGNSNYFNAAEKQGMSDTRFLENGKYFYDLSLEKNDRYPFDSSTTRFGDQYRKYGAYHGNSNENTYEFNKYSSDGFANKGEQFQDFQDDEGLP